MRSRQKFFSKWQNWLGLFLVAGFVLIAAASPLISPNDPKAPGPFKVVGNSHKLIPQPPSEEAPLGTLPNQISVFHAIVWGTRSALFFGLIVTTIAFIIGTLIGTISAYFGGPINSFLMWITNSFLTFPLIAGVLLFQQLITSLLYNTGLRMDHFGNLFMDPYASVSMVDQALIALLPKINPVLIAFSLLLWMPYARLMNASVFRIKHKEYVMAAQIAGVKNSKLIFRHLIPNAITPLIVLAAKDIGAVVVLQTTFAFIGFDAKSPWATILVRSRDYLYSTNGLLTFWWLFVPVTIMLVLFGIGWNLLGDGINDALNPRENG